MAVFQVEAVISERVFTVTAGKALRMPLTVQSQQTVLTTRTGIHEKRVTRFTSTNYPFDAAVAFGADGGEILLEASLAVQLPLLFHEPNFLQ